MAQLCLYVEDDLMARIREEAGRNQVSISKFVRNTLKNNIAAQSKWPDSFWDTFGAISDPTFAVPDQLNWDDDAQRLAFD